MRKEDIKRMLELVSDENLASALAPARRRGGLKRWAGLAACLGLAAVLVLPRFGLGGSSGGGGHGEGSEFMAYAGPVFPLTLAEENPSLSASRSLVYDFAPYQPRQVEHVTSDGEVLTWEEWSNEILVTDSYTLTNASPLPQNVTLVYPFAASYRSGEKLIPSLTAAGQPLEAALFAGDASGGYTGAVGSEESGELLNLAPLTSWQGYKALLEDGSHMAAALEESFAAPQVPVTVYTISEHSSTNTENPFLSVQMQFDPEKTTLLSYGFHAASWDNEAGLLELGFSIPEEDDPNYGKPFTLIVVGQDIEGYTLTDSRAGREPDTPAQVSAQVARTRENLDSVIRRLFPDWLKELNIMWGADADSLSGFIPEEQLYRSFYSLLFTAGPLASAPYERYDIGWLEDLFSDVLSRERVFYLTAPVTIPAGGSLEISAAFTKEASYDHHCANKKNAGVYGYDMVTRLGSCLPFSSVGARLENSHLIRILRQNYGFDPASGVTAVSLDPAAEQYYLEISRVSSE